MTTYETQQPKTIYPIDRARGVPLRVRAGRSLYRLGRPTLLLWRWSCRRCTATTSRSPCAGGSKAVLAMLPSNTGQRMSVARNSPHNH